MKVKNLNMNDLVFIEGKIYKLVKRQGSNGELKWEKIYLNLVTNEEDTQLIKNDF